MRAVILIDNLTRGTLAAEWGLSVYIEYEGRKILLDTGASGRFAKNAEALGIDLGAVDFGVLSHAHYDHADGLAAFFARNEDAPFYLREGAAENCYGKRWIFHKYIGIKHGLLNKYRDRIVYVPDRARPVPGLELLAHHTPGLETFGEKNHLYIRQKNQKNQKIKFAPDNFAHEQSLVFETGNGLVVCSSCSHAGADNIVREVQEAYPGEKIRALIGGFHLIHTSPADVRVLAQKLRAAGVEKIYTGHCTGQAAFEVLKEELDGQAEQLHTGLEIII